MDGLMNRLDATRRCASRAAASLTCAILLGALVRAGDGEGAKPRMNNTEHLEQQTVAAFGIPGLYDIKTLFSRASGHFSQFEPGVFGPILRAIRSPYDPWMTAADFNSYREAQQRAAAAYADPDLWARMAILNNLSNITKHMPAWQDVLNTSFNAVR